MKTLIAFLLIVAGSVRAQVPYVSAPTNSPVDTYVVQRSGGSGGHNKWVPYAAVTNTGTNTIIMRPGPGITISTNIVGLDFTVNSMWATNSSDGSIININPGSGIVSVGGLTAAGHATLMSDNLGTGGRLYNGKSNSVVVYAVDGSGDLVRIKNIPYIWPTSNAVLGQVLASTASGLLYWTNSTSSPFVAAGTNITLVTNGPVVTINGNPSDLWTNDLDGPIRITRPVDQTRMVEVFHVGTNNFAIEGLIQNTNAANQTAAGYFENLGTNSNPPVSLIGGNGGGFGLLGENAGNNGFGLTNGEGIGVQGLADSGFKRQFGVQGVAKAQYNVQTNVAGAFSASSNGKTGTTNTGLYVETQSGSTVQSNYVSSVAQLNSRDGSPLMVGQTNGATSYLLRPDGSVFMGKNFPDLGDFTDFSTAFLQQVSNVDSNDPPLVYWELDSHNTGFTYEANQAFKSLGDKDSPTTTWEMFANSTNGLRRRLTSQMIPGTSQFTYSSNSVAVFGFDDAGDLIKVKGVGYHWPATNATAGKVLASDGGSPQQLYWTNQPASGGGGGSGVGPGTAKRVAMFDSTTTNVTDSSLINSQTNEIDFKLTNGSYSTVMSNLIYGASTNSTGWRATSISVDPAGYTRFDQLLGSGVDPATFPRSGMTFNAAWLINGYGPTATGDGGGKTPDFLPLGDNVHDVGSGSSRVRHFVAGELGYGASPNTSAANFSGGFGLGMNSTGIDFYNNTASKTISFYQLSTAIGGYGFDLVTGFIAGGNVNGSPDVFLHRPTLPSYGMWSLGTNNNSTTKARAALISGPVSDDNAVNRAGGDLLLLGGPASGNGTNGNVSLGTFIQGASGFGYGNIQSNRLTIIANPINLTTNSATTILTFSVPTSLTVVGGKFSGTTEIKDATDVASLHEEFAFTAVNKAATVTATNSAPSVSSYIATGSIGVTTTWTVTVSGTTVSLKCNAVTTGINATTARVMGRLELDSDGTSVIIVGNP